MSNTLPTWLNNYITGAGLTAVTGSTSVIASVGTCYICNNTSQITITLPSTAAIGNRIQVIGLTTSGYLVSPNTNQSIIDANTLNLIVSNPTGCLSGTQNSVVDLEYVSTNTWQVIAGRGSVTSTTANADPFYTNVTALFYFNNNILDSSGNGLILTNNNVALSNAETKFGGTSAYFNGTSFLQASSPGNSTIFYGDFTVEAWINPTSYNASPIIFDCASTLSRTNGFALWLTPTGVPALGNASTTTTFGTAAVPLNVWTHIALTRTGSLISCFVNGTLAGTVSLVTTFSEGNFYIGRNYSSATQFWYGYMSNFRITNGYARYTSNFIPSPYQFPNISESLIDSLWNETTFLPRGGASNVVTDSSGNALTITNTSVTTSNVTTKQDAYSMVFNGTSSILSVASPGNSAICYGDFTVECWCYLTTTPGVSNSSIFSTRLSNSSVNAFYLGITPSLHFLYGIGGTAIITSTNVITLGTWYHLAVTRVNGLNTVYINGINNGTAVNTNPYTDTNFIVGWCTQGGTGYWSGNISGFRLTNGRARYAGNFTPPTNAFQTATPVTYDPFYHDVVFMPRGSASNIVSDVSGNALAVTNTSVTTTTTGTKQDGYSLVFNGSTSNLAIASTMYAFTSTTSFTIEAWIYPTANGESNGTAIFGHQVRGGIALIQSAINTISVSNMQVVTVLTSSSSVTLNQWTHVACVRNGGYTTIYINGVANGSAADTNAYTLVNPVYVGTDANVASTYFTGNMAGIRITNGYARYTANFTTPTTPFLTNGPQ